MKRQFLFILIIAFMTLVIIPISTSTVPTIAMASQQQQVPSIYLSSQNTNSSSSTSDIKNIFKQVEGSIVQITSKVPISSVNATNPQSPNATALGSGFVYDKLGHIITNNHVVGDAKIVDVTFVDGNRYTAKVVGSDIYSDVAVLQISQNTTQQHQQLLSYLRPLVTGNSSNLEVGDQVIAIGNPFGLSDTMTTGIVSGIGRLLPGGGFSIPNAIQTDAPINPGNSGGPLLDMQGKVVGMNTAILSGTGTFSGVGFAIPSNSITKIVPSLIEKGYYVHPYLGLSGATLTSDLAQNLIGVPSVVANLKGVFVDMITKNGPADKAGVHGSTTDQYAKKHPGDLITGVDGQNITRIDDLVTYIDQHKSVGDNATLSVFRNGHTVDLKVTLAARPSPIPFLIIRSAPPSVPSPPPRPHP